MIKPNLIASHDWHVQPNCQRSLRVIRLSGPLGSRPRLASGMSSNLMRPTLISFGFYKPGSFLREPFKTIEVCDLGQVTNLIPTHPCLRFNRTPKGSAKVGAKRRKFERSDSAINAQAARAYRSNNSWSCNGLFSLGNSLQGSNSTFKRSAFVPYPTLRTSSITLASHFPNLGRPNGHREALLHTSQLFKSSTRYP
jgi:hypothetical protein